MDWLSYFKYKGLEWLFIIVITYTIYSLFQIVRSYKTKVFGKEFDARCLIVSLVLANVLLGAFKLI